MIAATFRFYEELFLPRELRRRELQAHGYMMPVGVGAKPGIMLRLQVKPKAYQYLVM